MRWAIGVISSPRPIETCQRTIDTIRDSWPEQPLTVFREPGCENAISNCGIVDRPLRWHVGIGDSINPSPDGRFGNFGNWIQCARDLLSVSSRTAEAILIAEDDAVFSSGIRDQIEGSLWPSENCGVVSLYAPNMSQYRTQRKGLVQTRIRFRDPMSSVGNLVGALALVFRPEALSEIAFHKSIDEWKGSHSQSRAGVEGPWERKAVDTWIGRTVLSLGYSAWHFVPSMVSHGGTGGNSSLGHSDSSCRTKTV